MIELDLRSWNWQNREFALTAVILIVFLLATASLGATVSIAGDDMTCGRYWQRDWPTEAQSACKYVSEGRMSSVLFGTVALIGAGAFAARPSDQPVRRRRAIFSLWFVAFLCLATFLMAPSSAPGAAG